MDEIKVVEIIEKMGEFMTNTNEMIRKLNLRMNNIEVDVQKLRKIRKQYFTEPKIVNAQGIIQGGNGGVGRIG